MEDPRIQRLVNSQCPMENHLGSVSLPMQVLPITNGRSFGKLTDPNLSCFFETLIF